MPTLTLKPKYSVSLAVLNRQHFYDVEIPPDFAWDSKVRKHRFNGVTGCLSVIAKPALIPWAKKEALAHVQEALVKRLNGAAFLKQEIDLVWIQNLLAEASQRPEKIKDDAAEHGTDVHALIDQIIHGATDLDVPEAYAPAITAFYKWWKNSGIELVLGDTKVASLVYKYGGSLDALGRRDGKFVLLDWKTSNRIYPEMALQVSAYAQAFYETFGIYVQEGIIVRFGKKLPADFETQTVRNLEESLQAFLNAKALYESLKTPHFLPEVTP